MSLLPEPYYTACNEVFRRSTNQTHFMLKEMGRFCRDRRRVSILSVGSGVGLFEIPMLKMLRDRDVHISEFVGVDVSAHACAVLEENLEAEFGSAISFDVACSPFQDFTTNKDFDIVLYNHTFEYLGGRPVTWLRKSQKLLTPGGNVIIFSPNRGGINRIYGEVMEDLGGSAPFFADDIGAALKSHHIRFRNKTIVSECDVFLLEESDPHPDKIRLLSFLTQRDCRTAPLEVRESYVEYYLSLRQNGGTIPHPTTMFII